jgi:hypothetical protein
LRNGRMLLQATQNQLVCCICHHLDSPKILHFMMSSIHPLALPWILISIPMDFWNNWSIQNVSSKMEYKRNTQGESLSYETPSFYYYCTFTGNISGTFFSSWWRIMNGKRKSTSTFSTKVIIIFIYHTLDPYLPIHLNT